MGWDNLITTYKIRNARIVVMLKGGGAIVEQGDFEYEEGRYAVEYGAADRLVPSQLEHAAAFRTLGAPVPDAGEAIQARIVIDGMCDDGPVEIRGDGWFGYDDKGNIEGRFEPNLPDIYLDFIPDDEPKPVENEMSAAEWLHYSLNLKAKVSGQYERAARGRPIEDD